MCENKEDCKGFLKRKQNMSKTAVEKRSNPRQTVHKGKLE